MQDNYDDIFSDAERMLITVAHPDDMDISFGGLVARLRKDRRQVRVLVCTNGAFGSRENEINEIDLALMRKTEQINAAKILGIEEDQVFVLNNKDCTLKENDHALIERIAFHMREFRPDIVATHNFETTVRLSHPNFVWVNHMDHRAVGNATINAVMPMARDISFFPEHHKMGLKGISVNKILIPDFMHGKTNIRITEEINLKRSALLAHKSQMDEKAIKEIIDNYNVYLGQKIEPLYIERFKYFELGLNMDRGAHSEGSNRVNQS